MSKKCRAYSESKLGLEPADNRKSFYAGWEAAIKYVITSDISQECVDEMAKDRHEYWCASLTQMLLCDPPKRAPCDCKPTKPKSVKDECWACGGEVCQCAKSIPKREWVGLTDEAIWLEYQHLWPFHPAEEPTLAKDIAKFAKAIEAKLKEKNT